jgi:hypothetical protein
MWIKWLYCDHGWPNFKELEIPDDLDGEESVEDYLIQRRDLNIPTWSERYDSRRIKWEKLNLSPEEIKKRTIENLKAEILYHVRCWRMAARKLKQYETSQST